ncbi:MAG: aminotransferase class I/II-fold pyridoxal phosphate-dependent enzyme [Cyanobium sp.]|jgi:aspartate/methionine/tyrosine aminotransferase
MVGSPRPCAADRLDAVLDPVIPLLGELMRRRPDVLSLAQGMVSWAPPPGVPEAVRQALALPGSSLHRYGSTWGEPALLEQVARKLWRKNRLDLEGAALMVTSGSNMAFAALSQVICDPGSEVILPLPYYFNHAMAVQLAGGVVVPVDGGPLPDPDRLAAAITPRTRAIVTISPSNPSGMVLPRTLLTAINRLCASRGLLHISDEAYEMFVHGHEPHFSPGSLAGAAAHTVSLHSLSKGYGMAGWRMGYAAFPQALQPAMAKVIDTFEICPTVLSQRAAAAALATDPAWAEERVATLRPCRTLMLEAVHQWHAAGLPVRLWAEPDGAFYGLLVVEDLVDGQGQSLSNDALMEQLVLDHGVAAVSGSAFGLHMPGACVLRLSYGMLGEAELTEALKRLGQGLASLRFR